MGFIRQQEQKMALQLLTWQYQRNKLAVPDAATLEAQAQKLVDDAHRIAKERGRNVWGILKELVVEKKKE